MRFGRTIPFLIFVFSFASAHAKTAQKKDDSVRSITFYAGASVVRGVEQGSVLGGGIYSFSNTKFEALSGLQCTKDVLDITAAGAWKPFVWNIDRHVISIGIDALYHFQNYTDISNEHDIIGGLLFEYETPFSLKMFFNTGYAEKITTVFAVQNFVPYFRDHGISACTGFDKTWKSGFELYHMIGTHDVFRYPLFCTLSFTYGAGWNFKNKVRLSMEAETRMTDIFIVAANLDSMELRLALRYSF
jgi:hypothetical protein